MDLKIFGGKTPPQRFIDDIKQSMKLSEDAIIKLISLIEKTEYITQIAYKFESISKELDIFEENLESAFNIFMFFSNRINIRNYSIKDILTDIKKLGYKENELKKLKKILEIIKNPKFAEKFLNIVECEKAIGASIPLIEGIEYSLNKRIIIRNAKKINEIPTTILNFKSSHMGEENYFTVQMTKDGLNKFIELLQKINDEMDII